MSSSRNLLPCRLLLDLPNWVGDTIIALPAIQQLVEANRGGATVLHTRVSLSRLLAALFPQTAVHTSPRRTFPLFAAYQLYRAFGRFDLGVTWRNASRAKILLRMSTRRSYGSSSDGARVLLSRHFPVDRQRHQMHDLDPMLHDLGLEPVDPALPLRLPETFVAEGAAELDRRGLVRTRLVGLAPASAQSRAKQWPARLYGTLAAELARAGLQPVVLIGPGEHSLAQVVVAQAGLDLPVLGSDRDVAGLAGIISQLSVLVGNDSGPLHLADLAGVATVALFGPTDPRRTAPTGAHHTVLAQSLDCAPCNRPRCRFKHHECLRSLPVSAVTDRVVELERQSRER